jgi:hypothetical protein
MFTCKIFGMNWSAKFIAWFNSYKCGLDIPREKGRQIQVIYSRWEGGVGGLVVRRLKRLGSAGFEPRRPPYRLEAVSRLIIKKKIYSSWVLKSNLGKLLLSMWHTANSKVPRGATHKKKQGKALNYLFIRGRSREKGLRFGGQSIRWTLFPAATFTLASQQACEYFPQLRSFFFSSHFLPK